MIPRSQLRKRRSPTKAGMWCHLFVAAFVAFYLNYAPIHLATAMHLDDRFASVADSVLHHDGGSDDDHDTGHHVPHPASDHTLNLTAQTPSPLVSLAIVCVLLQTSDFVREPEQCLATPLVERIWPPGESPPDPSQPRAPPVA